MSIQITIPAWTTSEAEEGFIANWFVSNGTQVREGQVLGELMVEKATLEITAPQDGIIQDVRVKRGDVVRPDMVAAELVPTGETAAASATPASASAGATGGAPSPSPVPRPEAGFVPASPVARRLARELGVDLARVTPAHGQRITEEDVRRAAATGAAGPTTAAAPTAPVSPPLAGAPTPKAGEPLSGRRRVIAERMLRSVQTSAQLTLTTDVRADALVAARERLGARMDLTYTDLLAWATIQALKQHPAMNAALDGDRLLQHEAIHLGIAVSVPDGLLVPVVRDAGSFSLEQLAAQIRGMTVRARDNTATPGELSGSTFSLTTLGAFEIDAFTPILNPPEVGILGIGRIREAVVPENGQIIIAHMMVLSLTFDHRAIDGAPAAAFLQAVKHLVESPDTYAGAD